jgi:hypothetical protein
MSFPKVSGIVPPIALARTSRNLFQTRSQQKTEYARNHGMGINRYVGAYCREVMKAMFSGNVPVNQLFARHT